MYFLFITRDFWKRVSYIFLYNILIKKIPIVLFYDINSTFELAFRYLVRSNIVLYLLNIYTAGIYEIFL